MNKLFYLTSPITFTRRMGSGGKPGTCLPRPDYGPSQVHRAEFLNGMRVAAAHPMGLDIGACTVMFHVGSRHEFGDSLGVSHFIRAGSSTSGLSHSGFIRSRYLQQMGGYITCSSDRQTTSFTLRCPEPVFADLKCFFTDVIARCQYPEHELDIIRERVREDLEQINPIDHVIDLVQKACFIGPLSNSVFCDESRIDSIDSAIINEFIGSFFKTNVCTIGSSKVCYDETMKVGSQICCNRTDKGPTHCMPMSCPRGGYEFHDTGPGDTYIALGVPGCGTMDNSCCIAHAILAATLGLGNMTQGGHDMDRTPEAPLGTLSTMDNDIFTDYMAFNISYLDTGCFGILVKTHTDMAWTATLRAADFFANLTQISFEQINIGKRRLKLGMMLNDDSCVRLSENLALQIANGMYCDSAAQIGHMIDSTPPETVMEVAKNLSARRSSGQLALAVVGDVAAAPHDGEL